MTRLELYAGACLVVAPSLAAAQCESKADATPIEYLEYRDGRYTICYSPDYPDDLDLADQWVSRAFDLGFEKYGVVAPTYGDTTFKLTVYLPGAATARTSQGYVGMACCYSDGEDMHAEVHYLTPSAWQGDVLGGLRQPPEYYHPHYITHEVIHFFQWACCREAARASGYRWPTWLTEGMAESDGYRHTTAYSRTTAVEKLRNKILDEELDSVIYGRNLMDEQVLAVTSVYWAGGWVMNYLADTYGDAIHVDLLRRPLAEVLPDYGTSTSQLFGDLVDELADGRRPGQAYTSPLLACTGRYWSPRSGVLSFEVRILNNDQRPANHDVLRQQYRRDASRPWTTNRAFDAWIGAGDRSGFSTPLFTGPSSPPFQWRARSCPTGERSDAACSNWSNVINWTAATCAATRVR